LTDFPLGWSADALRTAKRSRQKYGRFRNGNGAVDIASLDGLRSAFVGILSRNGQATQKHEQIASFVVEYFRRRDQFYFHLEHRSLSTAMYFNAQTKRLLLVQADEFLSEIAELTGINMGNPAFKYISAAVEVAALHGTGIIPETYWASRTNAIYLSNGDGRVAKITAGNVELVDNGTDAVLFPVGATLPSWELVDPVDPIESCRLFRDAAYTDPHGKVLLKLWATICRQIRIANRRWYSRVKYRAGRRRRPVALPDYLD
jgi:hypothetical protein